MIKKMRKLLMLPTIGALALMVGAALFFIWDYLYVMEDALMARIAFFGLILSVVTILVIYRIISRVFKPLGETIERTHLMFEASPVAMFLYDVDENALDCNQKAQKLFGFPNKEAALINSRATVPTLQPNGEDSHDFIDKLIKKALKEGMASSETLLQRIDGTTLSTEITYVRVKYNGGIAIAEYIVDLRKHKNALRAIQAAEEKEREAERLNKIILDSAPLAINIRNIHNELLQVNQQFLDIFEIKDKEQYMRDRLKLNPKFQPCGTETMEKNSANFAEIIAKGKSRYEWMFQTYDGQPLPMEMNVVRDEHKGEEIFLAYGFDLRPIKKAMEEAEENKRQADLAIRETIAKSRFLAQISHEIRTPMNAVLGIAEIQLQNENLPPDLKESLTHIRNSSYLLLAIINNLLDMSKAEAGKMEIAEKHYKTTDMIVDTVQINMFYLGSKKLEFKVDVDENLPCGLFGDELRIKQIMNNLLSNAFKYTNDGSVELSIGFNMDEYSTSDEIELVISVKDTGRGMSKSQLSQLFGEEYLRFDENNTVEGSGLGMIITYQLVKMMGGKIEVDSDLGKGTKVTLHIPQKRTEDEIIGKEFSKKVQMFDFSQMSRHQVADFVREPMPYGRVLLVDDVELNHYVGKGHLAPYQLTIDTAMSGFETISMINRGESYDIIFMDHMMPELDGVETVKLLRENGYSGIIVALTANALAGNDNVFIQNGFDDFISKPIDIRDLNQVLNRYIRDRYPEEAAKYKSSVEFEKLPVKSGNFESESKRNKAGLTLDPKLMEVFIRDVENAIATIRDSLESADLKLFSTAVHSMKSALAYIGESESSLKAGKLEDAVRVGDMEYINTNANGFIKELESLLNGFVILKSKADDKAELFDDEKLLAQSLDVVKSACLDYDVIKAIDTLDELLKYPWKSEISDKLKKMHDAIFLDSDFDIALEIIKEELNFK